MITLNDILKIENLTNVRIRFNLMFRQNWNPIDIFKSGEIDVLNEGQYWNYKGRKSYKNGQITIGLIKIKAREDFYLLFHIGKITKDLNILNGVGYEYETLPEYEKYFGRIIVKYQNKVQTLIRNATSVIHDIEVVQILPDVFDNDIFPGYDKVNISWEELTRVLDKGTWKTALQNQKGIYLITDISNGKLYVGATYGQDMIWGRWKTYAHAGHGGNVALRTLDFDYIKKNFRYSILEIFKSTFEDQIILQRETWWKDALMSRKFGYNEN